MQRNLSSVAMTTKILLAAGAHEEDTPLRLSEPQNLRLTGHPVVAKQDAKPQPYTALCYPPSNTLEAL